MLPAIIPTNFSQARQSDESRIEASWLEACDFLINAGHPYISFDRIDRVIVSTSMNIINAFSVDVEDYFQVSAFENMIPRSTWDDYLPRVVNNTHRILNLLKKHDIRGTFFILGWVARRFPRIVKDIQKDGHELACHSYWHRLIYNMTPDDFREDLRLAKSVIEDISGEAVTAFRAPSFSITNKSLWALDILIEEGFQLDSSIFPTRHDRYGIKEAERFPHLIHRESGTICEFPPSIHEWWKLRIPIAGGGYFRLYPAQLSIRWLKGINQRHHEPFMFYIHPWEIDPHQPRLPAPLRSRWRHYLNLAQTETKLDQILFQCRFGTLKDSLESRKKKLQVKELVPC